MSGILLTPDQVAGILGVPRRRAVTRRLRRQLPWIQVSKRKLVLPAECLQAYLLDAELAEENGEVEEHGSKANEGG